MEHKHTTSEAGNSTRIRLIFRWILIAALGLMIAPSFMSHFLLWKMEHKAGIHFNKKPLFSFIPGKIEIDRIQFDYLDQFRVTSGQVKVFYGLDALVTSNFKIRLEGRNLLVQFKERLKKALDQNELVVKQVSAVIKQNGKDTQIVSLDLNSDTLQFHLKPKS